jgi:hypothetical protein
MPLSGASDTSKVSSAAGKKSGWSSLLFISSSHEKFSAVLADIREG